MRTEADLGRWLARLSIGRAGCVFSPDVADTLRVLEQAATAQREPLRVVALTWQEVPPLANELGLVVSALARATPQFFPALYGFEQRAEPGRWTKSTIENEAHNITRTIPDVDGAACRRILSSCQRGEAPSLGKLQRAEQARQLALAIDPQRLLVAIGVLASPASDESLRSLAQGTEWLATNTRSRVVLVLPSTLAGREELDHVTYGACLFASEQPLSTPSERSRTVPPPKSISSGSAFSAALVEPSIAVSPILGKPAKNSAAEQTLYQRITGDKRLRSLFAYNQRVDTRSGSSPRVDLLWEAGKLVIEVDGNDHRAFQNYSSDRVRDFELLMTGYFVVRFTESRVIEQTDWVIERIREVVRYLSERGKA